MRYVPLDSVQDKHLPSPLQRRHDALQRYTMTGELPSFGDYMQTAFAVPGGLTTSVIGPRIPPLIIAAGKMKRYFQYPPRVARHLNKMEDVHQVKYSDLEYDKRLREALRNKPANLEPPPRRPTMFDLMKEELKKRMGFPTGQPQQYFPDGTARSRLRTSWNVNIVPFPPSPRSVLPGEYVPPWRRRLD